MYRLGNLERLLKEITKLEHPEFKNKNNNKLYTLNMIFFIYINLNYKLVL